MNRHGCGHGELAEPGGIPHRRGGKGQQTGIYPHVTGPPAFWWRCSVSVRACVLWVIINKDRAARPQKLGTPLGRPAL